MEIKIHITDNNNNVLRRQYETYNLTNNTNISLDTFKELVFINGLLSLVNNINVRTKRNQGAFSELRNGEIIEYR